MIGKSWQGVFDLKPKPFSCLPRPNLCQVRDFSVVMLKNVTLPILMTIKHAENTMAKTVINYIRRFSRMSLSYTPFLQQILIRLRRCQDSCFRSPDITQPNLNRPGVEGGLDYLSIPALAEQPPHLLFRRALTDYDVLD